MGPFLLLLAVPLAVATQQAACLSDFQRLMKTADYARTKDFLGFGCDLKTGRSDFEYGQCLSELTSGPLDGKHPFIPLKDAWKLCINPGNGKKPKMWNAPRTAPTRFKACILEMRAVGLGDDSGALQLCEDPSGAELAKPAQAAQCTLHIRKDLGAAHGISHKWCGNENHAAFKDPKRFVTCIVKQKRLKAKTVLGLLAQACNR